MPWKPLDGITSRLSKTLRQLSSNSSKIGSPHPLLPKTLISIWTITVLSYRPNSGRPSDAYRFRRANFCMEKTSLVPRSSKIEGIKLSLWKKHRLVCSPTRMLEKRRRLPLFYNSDQSQGHGSRLLPSRCLWFYRDITLWIFIGKRHRVQNTSMPSSYCFLSNVTFLLWNALASIDTTYPGPVQEQRRRWSKFGARLRRWSTEAACLLARTGDRSLGSNVSESLYFISAFSHRQRGTHTSTSDMQSHFLVWGFRRNGHAYVSIHAYAPDDSICFDNRGKFGEGRCKIDLELECQPLVSTS